MVTKSVYNYINDMRSDLTKMEAEGLVDSSFTAKINMLDSEFTKMEEYWINQKEVSVASAFIFYSAMHNAKLVLTKMKERFEKAHMIGDNPGVACDSLLIMPVISEVYQKTVQATEEKQKLSPFLPNEMLKLVSVLRTTAKLVGLLPTLNEEVKEIDREQLKKIAVGLDKKFVASNLLNDI
ncbi:MAG: hypothetical protein V1915_02825 [Candidatus Bathyarchaeota archaeon]